MTFVEPLASYEAADLFPMLALIMKIKYIFKKGGDHDETIVYGNIIIHKIED